MNTTELKYPWDVLVNDLTEDWYSIPFETRLAMWNNVERDFGWMPCGNPDNTNTWWLACQAAVARGITPIREDVVAAVLKDYDGYDLTRDLGTHKFYENPYAKQKYTQCKYLEGGNFYVWMNRMMHLADNPLSYIPILLNLEWVSEGTVWDRYRASALAYRDEQLSRMDSWNESVVDANIQWAKNLPAEAEEQLAKWLDWPKLQAECDRWVSYFSKSTFAWNKPDLQFYKKVRKLWKNKTI